MIRRMQEAYKLSGVTIVVKSWVVVCLLFR